MAESLRSRVSAAPLAMRPAVLLTGLVLSSVAACDAQQPWFGPREVDVATAERRSVPELIDAPARLIAGARVDVVARTEGYLLERSFEDGSEVEQNQVLFRLESDAYDATLAEAEAELAAAEAAAADESEGESPAARAAVARAQARVVRARQDQSYTTLRAPIEGRIDHHAVDVGNLANAGDRLATIVQLDPILAELHVPAAELPRLQAAQREAPVQTILETEVHRVHERVGRVRDIAGEIDLETGTVLVRAVVPNPRTDLLAGEPVTGRLLLRWHEDAVVVPERAWQTDETGSFVRVVDDEERIERRAVEPGPSYAGLRVLSSGLEAGERVVIGRQRAAIPGRRVRAVEAARSPRPTPGLPPRLGPETSSNQE